MILLINKHQHCMALLSQTQKSSVFTAGVALCICLGGLSLSLKSSQPGSREAVLHRHGETRRRRRAGSETEERKAKLMTRHKAGHLSLMRGGTAREILWCSGGRSRQKAAMEAENSQADFRLRRNLWICHSLDISLYIIDFKTVYWGPETSIHLPLFYFLWQFYLFL